MGWRAFAGHDNHRGMNHRKLDSYIPVFFCTPASLLIYLINYLYRWSLSFEPNLTTIALTGNRMTPLSVADRPSDEDLCAVATSESVAWRA